MGMPSSEECWMHSYRPWQSLAYGMRLMRSPGGTWGVRYQDMRGLRRTSGTVRWWLVSAQQQQDAAER